MRLSFKILLLLLLTVTRVYAISNVFLAPKNFVGRQEDIQKVYDLLTEKNSIAITGCLGIGKTQLARNFVQKKGKNYDITWWIDSELDIKEQYRDLGTILLYSYPDESPNEKILEANPVFFVQSFFKSTKRKWLLVFDNFISEESLKDYICAGKNGHTIFTSRNNVGWDNAYPLNFLSETDSVNLIMKLSGVNKNEAKKFNDYLSGYPIIINQMCLSFRRQTNMNVESFIKFYLEQKNIYRNNEKEVLYKQIVHSYKYIESELPAAFFLIKTMAIFTNKNIPETLLKRIVENKFPGEYNKAISLINAKYAFVNRDLYEKGTNYSYQAVSYTMHDSFREVALDLLSVEEKKEITLQVFRALIKIFSQSKSELIKLLSKNKNIYNQALYIINTYKDMFFEEDGYIFLKIKLLEYTMRGLRNYNLGKIILDELKQELRQKKGKLFEDKLLYYTNKANFFLWCYDYSKSLNCIRKALSLIENDLSNPKYTREFIRLNRYQAYIEALRGEFNKAENTLNNSLAKTNVNFNKLNPNTRANHYYVKAVISYDKGNFREALSNYEKFIDIINTNNFPYKVYFHRKLLFLKIQNALGLYSRQISNNEKIEKEFLENSVALDHKAFARLYMERAKGEMNLLRYTIALEYIKKAILILKEWHKGENEHRNQGESYQIKGDILYHMNKIEEASKAYRRAWERYARVMVDFKAYPLINLFSMWAKCSILLKDESEYHENIKRLKKYLTEDKTELYKIYEFEISKVNALSSSLNSRKHT